MGFFELNIAMSGLFSAQKGLQVTGNNISNASTVGYSRQIITQKASRPISGIGVGMVGTGSEVTSINRKRDSYLDQKLWQQNGFLGENDIKVTQNSLIESVFGEPNTDSGFTVLMNNAFKTIDDLSKNPSNSNSKTELREKLTTYTQYYNNIAGSLKNYRSDLNVQLRATVQKINDLGDKIANLNSQITQAEIYGNEACSLRDERDNYIDELSKVINIQVTETELVVNGKTVTDKSGNPLTKVNVSIAGQPLVEDEHVSKLTLTAIGRAETEIDSHISKLTQLYAKKKAAIAAGRDTDSIDDEIAAAEENLKKINGVNIDANGKVTYTKDSTTATLLQVDGNNNTTVKSARALFVDEDEFGMYTIGWDTGLRFDMTDTNMSGELKGIIDMRDGAGTEGDVSYRGIPYYISQLDTYVQTFARSMNEAYSKDEKGNIKIQDFTVAGKTAASIKKDADGNIVAAYEADGTEITLSDADKRSLNEGYTLKYELFSYKTGSNNGDIAANGGSGGDYSKMKAENFSISKALYDDSSNIRTNLTDDEINISDGSLWKQLGALKDDTSMFKQGTPKDYMMSIFTKLGVSSEQAQMYQNTQTAVTKNIINQRLSVSQVDLSEEFTYLIQYQQAYQAAAKMMNTIDGIYETTIFKLGNW